MHILGNAHFLEAPQSTIKPEMSASGMERLDARQTNVLDRGSPHYSAVEGVTNAKNSIRRLSIQVLALFHR